MRVPPQAQRIRKNPSFKISSTLCGDAAQSARTTVQLDAYRGAIRTHRQGSPLWPNAAPSICLNFVILLLCAIRLRDIGPCGAIPIATSNSSGQAFLG
jgi:hypothetical protein